MHPRKLEISTKECSRTVLNTLKFSDLTLRETLHQAYSRLPSHAHDAASICLTLTGKGIEHINGASIVAEAGCVITRAPKLRHSDQYGAVLHRGLMIELEDKWLNTCRHFLRVFEGHRHFTGGPVPALALRVYRESRVKDTIRRLSSRD